MTSAGWFWRRIMANKIITKEQVKKAYLDMPWAILSPLGKKAIEVAFKDNFGFDYDALISMEDKDGE